jgi:hypothetical protein
MNPTEHASKTPSPRTGCFAALARVLHGQGTGALAGGGAGGRRTRAAYVVGLTLAAVLMWGSGSALAATPPEAPEITGSETSATEALVRGVLNPGKEGVPGTYETVTFEFLYKEIKAPVEATQAECESVGASKAPVPGATSEGSGKQEVAEGFSGLPSGTEYVVCLRVSGAGGEAVSAPAHFKTLQPPEQPETGKVKAGSVTSTTATLEGGVLNPGKAGEPGEYQYVYRVSPTECEGEGGSPAGVALGGLKEATPEVELTDLQPNAEYTVCLIEVNAAGYSPASTPVHFTTSALPPAIPPAAESVTERKPESAVLNGYVNPNNEETHYEFEYATKATGETLEGTIVKVGAGTLSGYPEQPVNSPTAALVPGTKYYYRVVAGNEQSEKEAVKVIDGEVEEFTAAIAPEAPASEEAKPIGGTTAELHGTLNPGKAGEAGSTYEFRYRPGEAGCEGAGELTSTPETATGATPEPVFAKIENLLPGTKYTFCLHVLNTAEPVEEVTGAPVSFTTLTQAPVVTDEQATEVSQTSTKLTAQLDPGGSPTTYVVQYGTSSVEEHSTPALSAGASATPVTVEQTLEGLTAGTRYEFRFVASNAVQAGVLGGETMFTTFSPRGSTLPDNRTYELVSNFQFGTDAEAYVPNVGDTGQNTHGIQTNLPFKVAPNGEAVVYPGSAPPTGGTGSEGVSNGNEYLATRGGGGGWTQVDLQPPGASGAGYQGFSSDLSVGILFGSQTELGGGPERYPDLYAHATAGGAGGEYDPFYTGSPPNRIVPTNVNTIDNFGVVEQYTPVSEELSEGYAGGNSGTSVVPAFSQLLFEANDTLPTLNVQAPGGGGEDSSTQLPFAAEDNLYDSAAGGSYLVNVLPDGAPQANASFGQFTTVGYGKPHGVSNAISADGSRIFWTALEGYGGLNGDAQPQALYVRENATQPDSSTVQVDQAQGGPESGGGVFWTASSDGSKVFFSDCRKLTADSTAVPTPDCAEHDFGNREPPTGNDLYEYEVNPETGKPGKLTDLTVDGNAGETADVQGVLGASENGEYVYFAAAGVLAANADGQGEKATPQSCTGAGPGEGCNLYVRHAGTTTFIATLSSADGAEVQPLTRTCSDSSSAGNCEGDWAAPAGWRTAQVTPDGHSLVFMSNESLTGYDNESAPYIYEIGGTKQETTERLDEVFRYEAESGAGPGSLTCVSCNPSGEAPVPTEFYTHEKEQPIGGFIPTSHDVTEQPRVISADGSRVFFDSGEPLLPAATNGWLGVYEWERDGAGSCNLSTGCVYLLSAGTDPENSYLLGADSSGDNAFLISRAKLVAADRGDGDVVYDARVDGVQAPAEKTCEGTGCQGVPPTPPIFATPSSATITGVDDLEPPPPAKAVVKSLTRAQKLAAALKTCRKEKKKQKRVVCEKAAQQKYGPVKKAKKPKKASKPHKGAKS